MTIPELVVERAGPQMSVVDAGRFGYRHEGIAWSGAADTLAYAVANAMLLDDGEAVVEMMFGEARFRFTHASAFSLTGADCSATLDGRRVSTWAKHVAHEGATLELRAPKRGVFTYLALAGGIDVPVVLGSRTTDRAAGFGGHDGRALRANDRLRLRPNARAGSAFAVEPPKRRERIRVIPGGEFDRFDDASRETLWRTSWRVGHDSNRMGYRLHGDALRYGGPELASHAVFPGVIQVPPSGEAIVLLADAHTTGGYPKAGVVIEADIRLVAQSRPGDVIAFEPTDVDNARAALQRRTAYLQALRRLAVERSG